MSRLPIMFEQSKMPGWLSKIAPIKVVAFSFFIFIWLSPDASTITARHEVIHYRQQVETLFFAHWLLYVGFWLYYRATGLTSIEAYRQIPFEREAYAHQYDPTYLITRKRYAWVRYV